MEERRKFDRLYVQTEGNDMVSCVGIQGDVKVVDISAGGMKLALRNPVTVGTMVSGECKILPNGGPFFISGKVTRSYEKDGGCEAVISFDKVSTIPLAA